MTPAAPPALVVDRLGKRYGQQRVLDGLSFAAVPGAVTVVGGTNGAGKSTLLRCLAGLARFEGTAALGDRPLDGSTAARRLTGYVPQRVTLPEGSTVGEVLALFATLRAAGGAQPLFPDGFLPPLERRLGTLSGGQHQRVVLAAALLGRPPLVLLDEPSANLDEEGRATLWEVLRETAAAGATVLVASPSPGDLAGAADHQLLLRDGRVASAGPCARLHAVATDSPVTPAPPAGPTMEVVR